MMTTMDVGKKLVELCERGKNPKAIEALYSQDILSIEPLSSGTIPNVTHGLDAVLQKTKTWLEKHDVHSSKTVGPFPHDDRFAVYFHHDVTQKASGKRIEMEEVAVYTVQNGKIVHEEFYHESI